MGTFSQMAFKRPAQFRFKIILPETLATERLYQGENKNTFVLIRTNSVVALGAIQYFASSGPFAPSQKHKIGIFGDAVKYLIRNI